MYTVLCFVKRDMQKLDQCWILTNFCYWTTNKLHEKFRLSKRRLYWRKSLYENTFIESQPRVCDKILINKSVLTLRFPFGRTYHAIVWRVLLKQYPYSKKKKRVNIDWQTPTTQARIRSSRAIYIHIYIFRLWII